MPVSNQNLIQRLQARNADRERATAGGIHPRRPIPPVADKELKVVERAISLKLPELLRAIYLRVGSGGFGPEYGIVGTKGGAKLDGYTLETCYQSMGKLEKENSAWRWPKRLLPVANYGCGNWGNSFWDQGRSLRTWLEGWLAGKQEPQPKWPSASWMKKRLGFTLPK